MLIVTAIASHKLNLETFSTSLLTVTLIPCRMINTLHMAISLPLALYITPCESSVFLGT